MGRLRAVKVVQVGEQRERVGGDGVRFSAPSRVPASAEPGREGREPYGSAFEPYRRPGEPYDPAWEPALPAHEPAYGPAAPSFAPEPAYGPGAVGVAPTPVAHTAVSHTPVAHAPVAHTPVAEPEAARRPGKTRTGPRPPRRSRAWPLVVVTAVVAMLCAVVAGVAASAAGSELTRGPDAAEIQRASAEEIARRWQVWPAERIFPATLSYVTEQGGSERARRVGVSSRTDCQAAVDARLRAALRAAGCRAVLRATYLDALQGVVITVGVAAFPDQASAVAAHAAFPRGGRPAPGLRALAFPGTVTDRFTAAGRQHGYARQGGPYVVAVTAGQVDGRPARAVGRQRETLFAFTADLADGVLRALITPVPPDCAAEEWLC